MLLIAFLSAVLAVSCVTSFKFNPSENIHSRIGRFIPINKKGVEVIEKDNSDNKVFKHFPDTFVSPPHEVFPEVGFCDQQSDKDLRPHPTDCTKFSICSASVLIPFTCPSGSVFHNVSQSCVPRGSPYDTCTHVTGHHTCPPGAVTSHPTECGQFYECAAQAERWEHQLRECHYPMLFNPESLRCEHYSMVTCGDRREPLDPCDYTANGCNGHAHCVPCSVRHPSCRGKKDGMNGWEGRSESPYYVVCADQRVVYHGMCSQEHGTQIFDILTGTCVMMNPERRMG